MYGFTSEALDIEDIRRRFRAMSDRDLLLTGEAAARLAADKGNVNSPPRDTWKVQFEEARAEWRAPEGIAFERTKSRRLALGIGANTAMLMAVQNWCRPLLPGMRPTA